MKLKSEPGDPAAIEKVELEFMRDKKMSELDEELYYVVDERGHPIDLTEKGRLALSPTNPKLWELPDIVEEFAAIEAGDFEVLELRDGMKALVTGKVHERAAYRKEDGWEITRHDGVQRIPHAEVARVVHGAEVGEDEREAAKEVIRTEHGVQTEKLHNISQLLRAYSLYEKDVEYVVQDNKVIIVDEFTGRLMPGRRWSDGLHQAVEAKEGVEIEKETQTLATITLQNYFRMYKKLAGMTGTAETEAGEFAHTYKMDVVVIPTNRPCAATDQDDLIYKTQREKYNAIVEEIARLHNEELPVLVGTRQRGGRASCSAACCARTRIPHNVLNAKYHEREAEIVRTRASPARSPSPPTWPAAAPTSSCTPGCGAAHGRARVERDRSGGLQIIGTERHEARRIDRQLRGRSGRQGDPGCSQVLPLARGRPDAPVRQRAHRAHHGPPRLRGGRGDHAPVGDPGHRERAEEGRGAQLRACASAPSTTTT